MGGGGYCSSQQPVLMIYIDEWNTSSRYSIKEVSSEYLEHFKPNPEIEVLKDLLFLKYTESENIIFSGLSVYVRARLSAISISQKQIVAGTFVLYIDGTWNFW